MEKILLYYLYTPLEEPELIAQWQRSLCADLSLRGRIIIAPEGINGTVGGAHAALEQYQEKMHAHPLFSAIDFKESTGSAFHFPRLSIKVKREIVGLGEAARHISAAQAAPHITPAQAHEVMSADSKDLVVFDVRNDYEWRIGGFKDAVNADISTFRELPQFIDENAEIFKDKDVVMACTGGVRCERASAYLLSKGIARTVKQIQGGIHRYLEEFPDGCFQGKNFVFDGRVALAPSGMETEVIAQCQECQKPCDEYTHCASITCNSFILLCDTCKLQSEETCSMACRQRIQRDSTAKRTTPFRYFPPAV